MEVVSYKLGKLLIRSGEQVNRLFVIYNGTVEMNYKGIKHKLGPGSVVGLFDAMGDTYLCDYIATEDVTVLPCYYTNPEDFKTIMKENTAFSAGFAKSAFNQCMFMIDYYLDAEATAEAMYEVFNDIFDSYRDFCAKNDLNENEFSPMYGFREFETDVKVEQWELDYISTLNSLDINKVSNFLSGKIEMLIGIIGVTADICKRAALGCSYVDNYLSRYMTIGATIRGQDMFELLTDIKLQAVCNGIDAKEIDFCVRRLYDFMVKSEIYEPRVINVKWERFNTFDFGAAARAHEHKGLVEDADRQLDEMMEGVILDDSLINGDKNAIEKVALKNSECIDFILNFASCSDDEKESFLLALTNYLSLKEKDSHEEEPRLIRKTLNAEFYNLYEKVFFNTLNEKNLEPVISMFLNFGFLDIDLVGPENADDLFVLNERLNAITDEHTFTMYTWLKSIYDGKREPGKSELDLDYRGFVIEQRKNGYITEKEMQTLMDDRNEKVIYEIQNFFMSANRIASGRLTTFCPILLKKDFINLPTSMALTSKNTKDALSKITKKDFGIFYREVAFADEAKGITNEPIKKEVLPDIILMPCAGTRSIMWQECGGVKIATPGRFVMPFFTLEDIDKMMLYCCGSFRWEVCKREQGSHWNEIGGGSLTSEFYDYFTFYRKNKSLSAEAKEKVKDLLKSSRNNMREAFTRQYRLWVSYEAEGNIRLNKNERELFLRYVPMAKEYRSKQVNNPMFSTGIARHENVCNEKKHRLEGLYRKYEKAGGTITKELEENKKFYEL